MWFILKNGRRFVASIISRPSAFAAVPIGGAMSFASATPTSIVTPGVTALLPISITARFSTKPEKEWEHERLQARATQLIAADTRSEADALFMAAQKELENFVRHVRYDVGTVELRYIGITSDMDGDTEKPVRLHHHVIINRAALKACIVKWARIGFVMEEELYHLCSIIFVFVSIIC